MNRFAVAGVGCQPAPQEPDRDLLLARVPQPVQYPEVPFTPAAPPPGPLIALAYFAGDAIRQIHLPNPGRLIT